MVPLLRTVETAKLPPKTRAHALGFVVAIRGVARDRAATLADQLSMLIDRTGYRAMLRESRAEETVDRLENLQELLTLAGGFHTATELLDHAALASAAPGETIDGRVQLMTLHKGKGLEFPHVFLAGWDTGAFPSRRGSCPKEPQRLVEDEARRSVSNREGQSSLSSAAVGHAPPPAREGSDHDHGA